jgi:hypothetical protein
MSIQLCATTTTRSSIYGHRRAYEGALLRQSFMANKPESLLTVTVLSARARASVTFHAHAYDGRV